MRRRSSLFAAVAGPRAKWIVFGVWFVVIFAVVHRRRAREVHGRPGERVDVVPARRRRVDQGAARDRGSAGRRTRPRGHPLPPRERPDRGRQAEDRRRRRTADRSKRFPGVVADGATAAAGGGDGGRRRAAPDRGLRRTHHADPRPAGRLRAVRRPGVLAGRQGRARVRLRPRRRRVRDAARPGRVLARDRQRSGRRPRGQDHRRRRLRRRRDRGLREHQRHAARRRDAARRDPPDPDLPLADLPVHPAWRR